MGGPILAVHQGCVAKEQQLCQQLNKLTQAQQEGAARETQIQNQLRFASQALQESAGREQQLQTQLHSTVQTQQQCSSRNSVLESQLLSTTQSTQEASAREQMLNTQLQAANEAISQAALREKQLLAELEQAKQQAASKDSRSHHVQGKLQHAVQALQESTTREQQLHRELRCAAEGNHQLTAVQQQLELQLHSAMEAHNAKEQMLTDQLSREVHREEPTREQQLVLEERQLTAAAAHSAPPSPVFEWHAEAMLRNQAANEMAAAVHHTQMQPHPLPPHAELWLQSRPRRRSLPDDPNRRRPGLESLERRVFEVEHVSEQIDKLPADGALEVLVVSCLVLLTVACRA